MAYPVTFECKCVLCKNPKCDGGNTRLPLPNLLDTETYRINSPTDNEPLIVLCTHCWKISKYTQKDFQVVEYPRTALSPETPFYMVEIVCGAIGCGLPTRAYMRAVGEVTDVAAIGNVKKELGGIDALCPDDHPLATASTRYTLRKIVEEQEYLL